MFKRLSLALVAALVLALLVVGAAKAYAGYNCDADFTNSGWQGHSYGVGTVDAGDRLYLYSYWGDGSSRTVRSSVAQQNDTTFSLDDFHNYSHGGNPVYIEVGSNSGQCATLNLTF